MSWVYQDLNDTRSYISIFLVGQTQSFLSYCTNANDDKVTNNDD